jgi:hypothetical protein
MADCLSHSGTVVQDFSTIQFYFCYAAAEAGGARSKRYGIILNLLARGITSFYKFVLLFHFNVRKKIIIDEQHSHTLFSDIKCYKFSNTYHEYI